jgi:phosphoribosylformylglycinamidine synthase
MKQVRILVIRAAGINCDEEVMHAWRLSGAEPALIHVNRLADKPSILDPYRIVTIPGGFSFGDDIAAGTILAQRVTQDLREPLHRFVERGGGIFGICNGFQVLVKAGLLPGGDLGADAVTVTFNDSARFEARWVRLQVCTTHCPFLTPGTVLEMPVEHAEGKVVTRDDMVTRALASNGLIAVRYVDEQGRSDVYPANPNGSVAGIAGLCDATGRVFGLMPHPDRHLDHTQHPLWTRHSNRLGTPPDGLTVFLNAVHHWGR